MVHFIEKELYDYFNFIKFVAIDDLEIALLLARDYIIVYDISDMRSLKTVEQRLLRFVYAG